MKTKKFMEVLREDQRFFQMLVNEKHGGDEEEALKDYLDLKALQE